MISNSMACDDKTDSEIERLWLERYHKEEQQKRRITLSLLKSTRTWQFQTSAATKLRESWSIAFNFCATLLVTFLPNSGDE